MPIPVGLREPGGEVGFRIVHRATQALDNQGCAKLASHNGKGHGDVIV